MSLFMPKGERLAELFTREYFASFQRLFNAIQQQGGYPTKPEIEILHRNSALSANKKLIDRGYRLVGIDELAESCFPEAIAMVRWEEPTKQPTPRRPTAPLNVDQESMYRQEYDRAFDEWMILRIKSGNDSQKDFERADVFARMKAEDALTSINVEVSEDECDRLADSQKAACLRRLGYAHYL